MSYLQDRKTKKEKYLKVAAGIFVLAFLFYFRAGIFHGLTFVATEIFRPVLALGGKSGGALENLGAYFSSKSSLSRENEELKRQLENRDDARSNYNVLLLENESLKKILWRVPENKELVLAAIIGKPERSPYDTLLIDLGADAGLKEGAMVYAEGNLPIGRTAMVTPETAKVLLFSSPGEHTEVAAPSSTEDTRNGGIFWEIVGRGGGNFEMILPRDFILEKGDAVVLPGLEPLSVAVAEKILSDPRSPWKTALLRSPVNIAEIKFVQVEIRN